MMSKMIWKALLFAAFTVLAIQSGVATFGNATTDESKTIYLLATHAASDIDDLANALKPQV